MRFSSGFLLFSLIGLATAPPQFPDWPLLPAAPVVPQPMPPGPSPASILSGDYLYVVQSDEEVQLLASPPGLVDVATEVGPIRIRGKFVDGSGAVETRVYTKKQVFLVTRLQPGNVELLLTPKGAVTRRLLTDGDPAPPPKPKPPTPEPPQPLTSFRVIFVYESADLLTPAQSGVIFGRAVEEYMTANCTGGRDGWRRRDKDATGGKDSDIMNKLWAATQPKITVTPCVAVERNLKVEIIPLAPTPAEMIAVFKTYAGGK